MNKNLGGRVSKFLDNILFKLNKNNNIKFIYYKVQKIQKIFYTFLVYSFAKIFPNKLSFVFENFFQNMQGKGFNSGIKNEVKSISKFLDKSTTKIILDIGAYNGFYTEELFKKYPEAQYYLFEPQQINYSILIEKFKNKKNIKMFNCALSYEDGEGLIFSDELEKTCASLLKRDLRHFGSKFDKEEKVKKKRLDSIFEKELKYDDDFKVSFCKIDIEGHELDFLISIKKYFNKFEVIQFEFGGPNIDGRYFFKDFWYLLKDKYNIYRITPSGPKIIKRYIEYEETFLYTNFIAVNKNL